MTKKTEEPRQELVLVPEVVSDTKSTPHKASEGPQVGEWYWVDVEDGSKELGCLTHLGTNYAKVDGVKYHFRIHYDDFFKECHFEPNPDQYIDQKIEGHQRKANQLMGKVRELTARLAITPAGALTSGNETQALAIHGHSQSMEQYKAELILAKEKTFPDLFKEIKEQNEQMGKWMQAKLIPLEASARGLEKTMDVVQSRIFNVELYAGLVETVTEIRSGEPAPNDTKVHLMQRRCYMDEECLAHYETGGMEFHDLPQFEKWLARRDNMERLFPFPRCVVAFKVRRERKEREIYSISDFIKMMELDDANKLTFLYLRNGDQMFRLQTKLDFDEKLFPDVDRNALASGKTLWVKNAKGGGRWMELITDDAYRGILEKEKEDDRKYKAAPKEDKWRFQPSHFRDSREYTKYTTKSVYYDDMNEFVAGQMAKHNRLVLVLQGLLDRSPVFHPHPPFQLWTLEGFESAMTLIYDDSRTLTPGDKPDFEAYRAKLNESLKAGSITVGQELAWEIHEAEKENARLDRSYRGSRNDYRHTTYRPYGNPGPGEVSRMAKFGKRTKKCTFTWTKPRERSNWRSVNGGRLVCSLTVDPSKLLNVDAYKPGDFKIFFNDPRTRAEYLQWATLLLTAEEYHAGNRKPQEPAGFNAYDQPEEPGGNDADEDAADE